MIKFRISIKAGFMVQTYLQELNDVQSNAVCDIEGPKLVIAGAGSGKTKVLTYRIAYLLEKGVDPRSILALTFTNKAATEMKERVAQLISPSLAYKLMMGTFHSIFSRILRKEADKLGYSSNYTIYDTGDSRSLIKAIIKELGLDEKQYKPNQVHGRISYAKNYLVTPQAYYSNQQIQEADKRSKKPRIADIYKLYAMRCKKADAMDFDDLLLNINILFRDYPEVLKQYRKEFQYILVDEFQDTNYSQYLIVSKMASEHRNICVVGDDAQSIYAFRGAKIENILNFKNDFSGCKIYKLEQNYRSTQNIVNAANSVIHNNNQKIHKQVFSRKGTGNKIRLINGFTDKDEAYKIAKDIQKAASRFEDIAILYRLNMQSRSFEEAFRKLDIPYKIYGGQSFYQRKEIKDVLAYMRLITNPNDDEAFKRIINYPARGIGKTTLGKLEEEANRENISLWALINQIRDDPGGVEITRRAVEKITRFVNLIEGLIAKCTETDAYDLACELTQKAGIFDDLSYTENPENISKYENIQELLNSIKEFTDKRREEQQVVPIHEYLENISLMINEDTDSEEERNKVALMTIHAAKGLEFENVYIVGAEEELFPSKMTAMSSKELEEERRLFYVALTRAKSNVVLSYANERYKYGNSESCKPSRFIFEIEESYMDMPNHMKKDAEAEKMPQAAPENMSRKENQQVENQKLKKVKDVPSQTSSVQSDRASGDYGASDAIKSGMRVSHSRFGEGKVLQVEGEGHQKKATVFFREEGQKQLLLKYAKLKILDSN